MDETREEFLNWCRDQRNYAQRVHALYASGRMRFLANNVDISKQQMASLERVIEEMTALIDRIEAEP